MKPIYQMVLFFTIAQILALFVGTTLIDYSPEVIEYQLLNIAPEKPGELFNILYFIGMILVAAVMVFVILIFPIRDLMIKVLEFISTIVASTVVLFVFFSSFGVPSSDFAALVFAILLYVGKTFFDELRNVLAITASAGVGSLIGFSIDPFPTILFVILIAVYDIIAVWWTGHMIEFARYFVKMKTAFTLSAKEVKIVKTKRKGKIVNIPRRLQLELGTGDLAIPAALVVSVYKLGSIL